MIYYFLINTISGIPGMCLGFLIGTMLHDCLTSPISNLVVFNLHKKGL